MKYIVSIVVLSVACLTASAVFGAQSAEPAANHVRADDLIGAMQRHLKPTWPLAKIQLLYKGLENVGYDLRYEVDPLSGGYYDMQNIMDLVNFLNKQAEIMISKLPKGSPVRMPSHSEIVLLCELVKTFQPWAKKHKVSLAKGLEIVEALPKPDDNQPPLSPEQIEQLVDQEITKQIKAGIIIPDSLPDSASAFTQCKNHLFRRWYLYAGGAVVVGLVAGALVYYFKINKKEPKKPIVVPGTRLRPSGDILRYDC